MAQLVSLSDEDLAQLRGELAGGRPPMVWFTPAAVGVAAGGSAKIVAFADTEEGDFIQVRPTGSKDVLSFSPSELTRTRPPRRKTVPPAGRAATPAAAPAKPAEPRPQTKPAPAPRAAPAPPPAVRPPVVSPPPPAPPRQTRPAAPRRGGRAPASPELTVILSSTPSGEWSAEVTVGTKRTVRPVPVPPADIAKATRALPAAVAEAVDRALDSARRQQEQRIAQLRAELEQAQRALDDLG